MSHEAISAAISAAITVTGMVSTTAITMYWNYKLHDKNVRSERLKLRIEADLDARHRREDKRVEILHNLISGLLCEIDPQVQTTLDQQQVVSYILRAQLLLDLQIADHVPVNSILTAIGFAATSHDRNELVRLSGHLIESTRCVLRSHYNAPNASIDQHVT